MLNCIFVGIGGFIGSVLRYLVGMIPLNSSTEFPFNTLIINVLGSFVIGLIIAVSDNKNINPQLMLLLKVGVCGGFTTFSTFAYETSELIQNGSIMLSLTYIITSFVLSIAAVFLAQALIK